MKRQGTIVATICVILVALIAWSWATYDRFRSTADRLLLLVPDGVSFSNPKVTMWLDAGSEEGLHVVPVHDSEFLRPVWGESQCAGVILPDSIHQQASDLFVSTLHRYVAEGGRLMLVYDAGTFSLNGAFAAGGSRMSDLAGVDYALYDKLGDKTIQWSRITSTNAIVSQTEIPPGKYYPFHAESRAALKDGSPITSGETFEIELRRYKYGDLEYPSFVTSGNYSGEVLFRSNSGLVAGQQSYQKGSVLFVNLPLGYLKGSTDGLLLHVFLKYFAGHVLSLPYLMPVPDGVGGLVLNWHIDSNAAIKPLQEISSWTLLRQGPYSIHITAGPDSGKIGDRKGFDVDHNPVSQDLIRKYVGLGYDVGSHGGWIHDYFSAHVETDNPKDLEQFLALNKDALERVSGKPVVEYSAPNGNQPPWVTHWLEAHGFVAYYFTGDTGMGPTEGYRNGEREGRNIWAFPILHLDRAAGFEELSTEGYSNSEIARWLAAITDFTTDHRSVRLVYFHPPGILQYHGLVDRWLEQTARLKADGRFRWYTMTELANFLNSRKQVKWKMSDKGAVITVEATHPQSLDHETWRIPAGKFAQPRIVEGAAKVVLDQDAWMVIAGEGKDLRFETEMLNK
jgi:peptidoglycan/xylan/chitin deacetylase (PgdA/CDA1 family)